MFNVIMNIKDIRRENARLLAKQANDKFPIKGLAEKLGKPHALMSHYIGKTPSKKIGDQIAREIEVAFGLPKDWMDVFHNEEMDVVPSDDDYVLIPQYDASAACGNGHLNDYVTVKGGLAFRRDWIKSMGWQSAFLSVLYAVKDSMSPTINDGAIVLVNAIEKEPRSGSLYLISWYGEERIKRVFKDGNTVYRFSSDNQNKAQYPDERVDLSQTPDVFILGRVVWQAGTL